MVTKRNEISTEQILEFSNEINQSPLVSDLLLQKGLDTVEKVEKFIYPDIKDLENIFSYTGMEDAIKRIQFSIENNERIVVYGDYDCDGVCAVAILYSYLSQFPVETGYFIPNRNDEGYGLHIESLELIAERFAPDLIITVDCGITGYDEVEYAKDVLGIDIIITDHHELAPILPKCIVINPKIDEGRAFPHYCGAGVALRLVQGLSNLETMLKYVDIAAIATIADMVPLIDDNRIIASLGIQKINKERNGSIYLMAEMSGVKGKITSTTIAFQLAPRLNALGRLGDASEAVELFTSKDRKQVKGIIEKLDLFNKERRELTKELTSHCIEMVKKQKMQNNNIIVLYNNYWISGILGITCSNLVKIFNKPVIILTKEDNLLKGSGRSINGINIFQVVSSVRDLLKTFGGHSMACGITVEEHNIEELIKRLNEYIEQNYTKDVFVKNNEYDAELNENITVNDIQFIEQFEPYGMANAKPKFKLDSETGKFKHVSLNSSNHIKEENENFTTMLFNKVGSIFALNKNIKRSYLGNISLNSFNGKDTVTLIPNNIFIDVENNIEKIDIEEELARFIYSLRMKNTSGEYNIIFLQNEQELISLVNNEMFGTVYIAYFKDTYDFFLNLMNEKQIKNQIRFKNLHLQETEIPYNGILLDPIGNINLEYYNNIIFLDPPISELNLKNLNISKESTIFSCFFRKEEIKEKIKKKMIKRDGFALIFKNIKDVLLKNSIKSLQELYNIYQHDFGDISQVTLYIVIYTLMELGIFKYIDGSIKYDNKVKSSLDNSIFYNNLKRYVDLE